MSTRWPPDLPFTTVLERARRLDRDAVGQLYARYLPTVYRFVLGRVGDVHLAEDLTAETFFAMVESVDRVRAGDELSFAAWLLGIARNKAAEHFRRQAVRAAVHAPITPGVEPQARADADDPQRVVAARESWAEVVAALRELTEEQRQVVLYSCVLGYTTDEVARLMERQPGAIRALRFRALAALARALAARGTHPALAALRATFPPVPAALARRRTPDAPRR